MLTTLKDSPIRAKPILLPTLVLATAPFSSLTKTLVAAPAEARPAIPQTLGELIAESYSEIFRNCVSLRSHASLRPRHLRQAQDAIEADPAAELSIDVAAATVTAGGETISLEIQPGAQGQYLDGSWDSLISAPEPSPKNSLTSPITHNAHLSQSPVFQPGKACSARMRSGGIVEYLKTPDEVELKELLGKPGLNAHEVIRSKEGVFPTRLSGFQ